MRITSGKFKGRVLIAPSSLPVRPTTDFAKQALFNILNNLTEFENIKFLDLFAGTGNISFEMASRGCSKIVCVDENVGCTNYIKETAFKLGILGLESTKAEVSQFLKTNKATFDVVFADPPFEFEKINEVPDWIFNNSVLSENGIFILEHSVKINFETHPNLFDSRNYGKLNFSFFKKNVS